MVNTHYLYIYNILFYSGKYRKVAGKSDQVEAVKVRQQWWKNAD